MVLDTLLSTFMMIVVGIFAWKTYTMPKSFPTADSFVGKRVLLVLLCLVFGVEIGYKICSRELLYLLNPCHVITMIEVTAAHSVAPLCLWVASFPVPHLAFITFCTASDGKMGK